MLLEGRKPSEMLQILFLFNKSGFYNLINMKDYDMCKTYETFIFGQLKPLRVGFN